ncbi:MAG: hypothetical protein JSR41_15005 [Proteobacteria bacterium]|nr:hypothetical protein [Pseudomonadota bacterium]
MTQGTEQSVKVETITADGRALSDAECVLVNEKGRAVLRSGKAGPVRRAGGDMTIRCELDGQVPALGQAVSRGNAGLAGNILLGGAIGAAVDVGTGAAYTYPTWMQLVFGQERRFDRQSNRGDGPTAGELLRVVPASEARAAQVDAPVAAPASPVLAASAPTAAPVAAALRRGDVLEYRLTDGLTGNSSRIYYRVDRAERNEVVFNQGARVETSSGRLISLSSPTAGLFDASSPPEGWVPPQGGPGTRWQESYVAQTGPKWRHELQATITGRDVQLLDGQPLDVLRLRYEGWVYTPSGLSMGSLTGVPFQADVSYAPALQRPVKFDATMRQAYGPALRESLELVRIQR